MDENFLEETVKNTVSDVMEAGKDFVVDEIADYNKSSKESIKFCDDVIKNPNIPIDIKLDATALKEEIHTNRIKTIINGAVLFFITVFGCGMILSNNDNEEEKSNNTKKKVNHR